MSLSDKHRFLKLKTVLGEDAVLLLAFSGREELSKPFLFELDLISEDFKLSLDQVIGTNVTFSMELQDANEYRFFNGHISQFSQVLGSDGFAHYRAEVVPWLWFLTKTSDCRLFQNKTVPDIIEQLFSESGFHDYKFSLLAQYEPLEYCVQYRETTFNFISRIMEKSGIFYSFSHSDGKHTLVCSDSHLSYEPCSKQTAFSYYRTGGRGKVQVEDGIKSWQFTRQLRAGRFAMNDYNFERPMFNLQASSTSLTGSSAGQNLEIYDYPGGYKTSDQGREIVDIRMDEEDALRIASSGTGNARLFRAGAKFSLKELPRADQNIEYVLISVDHNASQRGNFQGTSGGGTSYSNEFSCIPSSVRFRPARMTPEPVMQGSQTALVVGLAGDEIYTDKYGRVKVQFHWDRRGKYDENSSCWIRVSQRWAGNGWGSICIPRIGQEVVVDFIEGDPDQPIIVGSVYNGDQSVPYNLPEEKTKSTIKSYSSIGGGGFNEFRFEDKKGKEEIFLNAEKDLHFRVNDSRYENIDGSANLVVAKDQIEHVKGDKHLSVDGDLNEKVDGSTSLKIGGDLQQKIGTKYAIDSGMEIHLKAGVNMTLESGTSLTLKVGGNFININPAGVFITGTMVMMNSGGAAGSGSGSSPTPPQSPRDATKANPGNPDALPQPKRPPKPIAFSQAAMVLQQAARTGTPFCAICNRNRGLN